MSGTDCALGLFCSIKVEFRGWKQQRTEDEKIPFNASLCNSTSRTESQVAKSLFRKTTGRRRRHRRDVTLSRAAREGVRGGLINTNFQGWMCLSVRHVAPSPRCCGGNAACEAPSVFEEVERACAFSLLHFIFFYRAFPQLYHPANPCRRASKFSSKRQLLHYALPGILACSPFPVQGINNPMGDVRYYSFSV